jgi:hypothetical protein
MEDQEKIKDFQPFELVQIAVNARVENDYDSLEQVEQEMIRRHALGIQALKNVKSI